MVLKIQGQLSEIAVIERDGRGEVTAFKAGNVVVEDVFICDRAKHAHNALSAIQTVVVSLFNGKQSVYIGHNAKAADILERVQKCRFEGSEVLEDFVMGYGSEWLSVDPV